MLGSSNRDIRKEQLGTSKYYRMYTPNGYNPEADENGHVPTLAERLEKQVTNGEREEPKMSYKTSVNELRTNFNLPNIPVGEEVGWNPDVETVHINFQPPRTKYQFQSVIVTKKLKGEFGDYTIFSDGQMIAELLVSGTMTNDAFVKLVDEINAVREEMEAMQNG